MSEKIPSDDNSDDSYGRSPMLDAMASIARRPFPLDHINYDAAIKAYMQPYELPKLKWRSRFYFFRERVIDAWAVLRGKAWAEYVE